MNSDMTTLPLGNRQFLIIDDEEDECEHLAAVVLQLTSNVTLVYSIEHTVDR